MIVDEFHALVASKLGAHLFATLERLEAWRVQNGVTRPLQRVGLSATQRPLDEVAQLLGGCQVSVDPDVAPQPRPVTLIEAGRRAYAGIDG